MDDKRKGTELTDDDLSKISGGEDMEFCPEPCNGECVGNCKYTRYICPFK